MNFHFLKKVFVYSFVYLLTITTSVFGLVIDADDPIGGSTDTVIGLMQSTPDIDKFTQIVIASGLSQELEGAGPFTVLAPSNAAFEAIPEEIVANLKKKENLKKLQEFIKNHIVQANLTTDKMNNGNIKTLSGKFLHIQTRGAQVMIDNATIIQSDLTSSNGVIQVIDTVLFNNNKQ